MRRKKTSPPIDELVFLYRKIFRLDTLNLQLTFHLGATLRRVILKLGAMRGREKNASFNACYLIVAQVTAIPAIFALWLNIFPE
jgi:hypothetical protein